MSNIMERCCCIGAEVAAERAEEAADAAHEATKGIAEAHDLAADAHQIARKAEETAEEALETAGEAKELAVDATTKATAVASDLTAHKKDTAAHGATTAPSANAIALREAGGALRVGAPGKADHAVTKHYFDSMMATEGGSQANASLAAHIAQTSAHSATVEAAANRVAMRDDGGRLKIGTPAVAPDAANKGYVDQQISLCAKITTPSGETGNSDSKLPAGTDKELALIPELGLFQFNSASSEPLDGETIIAPASGAGRWELVLPSTDFVLALAADRRTPLVETVSLAFEAIPAGGSAERTITTHLGVTVSDIVVVTPPSALADAVVYVAYAHAAGEISLRLTNAGQTAVTLAQASWTFTIHKQGKVR